MTPRPDPARARRAQAVIELAVFGAVVLFIIGSIVQQTGSAGMQQNAQLRALRIALFRSNYGSQVEQNLARSNANFSFVEDRISLTPGKYGGLDRSAYVASAAGIMTTLLYKPVDWEDLPADLPLIDFRINGQDFTFRQGVKVVYRIRRHDDGHVTIHVYDEDHCGQSTDLCSFSCELPLPLQDSRQDPALNPDAFRLAREGFWGYVGVVQTGDDYVTPSGMSVEQRNIALDLHRDGTGPITGDIDIMDALGWQWVRQDLSTVASEIDEDNGSYPSYDIDGDLEEEVIYDLQSAACGGFTTVQYKVMDLNAGDIDSAPDGSLYRNPSDVPGFKSDMLLLTNPMSYERVPGSNYLEIREGELFQAGTNNRVGSLSKKMQLDVISRRYVLNSRMIHGGSLCDDNNNPKQRGVELCCNGEGCCGRPGYYNEEGSALNQFKTCVQWDQTTGIHNNVLYIRSRVRDERAHGWITATDAKDIGDQEIFK